MSMIVSLLNHIETYTKYLLSAMMIANRERNALFTLNKSAISKQYTACTLNRSSLYGYNDPIGTEHNCQ